MRPALQCRGIGKFGYQIGISGSAVSPRFDDQSRRTGSDFAERFEDPLHGRLIRLFLWRLEDVKQNPFTAGEVFGEECLHPPAGDRFKKLVLVGKFHGFRWLDGPRHVVNAPRALHLTPPLP